MGLWYLWFYVQELPKAQPAVVLVLKRLRRRVNGLKSHPTDWEKPGIEPATPGLQDIGLSPTPRRLYCSFLVSVDFLWQSFKHTNKLKNAIFSVTLNENRDKKSFTLKLFSTFEV